METLYFSIGFSSVWRGSEQNEGEGMRAASKDWEELKYKAEAESRAWSVIFL